jgi:glycerol-3-phosphate O-acyltransferase
MTLYIDHESQIKNIQNEFNEVYPFLKIEFFKNSSTKKKPLQKSEKINAGEKVKLVTHLNRSNKIDISKQRTVAQLEKDFKELFGLNAQLYRKLGNLWIETFLTDDWTLEQQNREGGSIN